MNPLITLSIPIYNVEKYVEKSLGSALNQTYDNLEILVIDDKGADNSMDEVRRIIDTHSRGNIVRIIEHDKNQGLGATRNTSIDNAKGEYIFFMDSDDEITTDCIATLYAAMKETPVDFVVGSIDEVDDEGNILLKRQYIDAHYTTNNDILHSQYDNAWISTGKSSYIIVPIWNKLYNLSFLRVNSIKCIPYQKNEDLLFTFTVYMKANSCRILSRITYRYDVARPGSITNEAKKEYTDFQLKQEMDNLEYYSSYIDYIKNNKGEAARHVLSMIVMRAFNAKYNSTKLRKRDTKFSNVSEKIKTLIKSVKYDDIYKSKGYLFQWLYLKSPIYVDWIFEFVLGLRTKLSKPNDNIPKS